MHARRSVAVPVHCGGDVGKASMIQITIDGQRYKAEEGTTVLQVAMANGIQIPTLCYHPALRAIGACKVCAVAVVGPSGKTRTLLSCVLKAKDGMQINTQGDMVIAARTAAFRNLIAMAPQSAYLRKRAEAAGVDLGPPPDGCIRCRLCVRVCNEVVGAKALKMEKQGPIQLVVPQEGRCIGCGTCANLCPTGAIQVTDSDGVRTIRIRDDIIGIHALERCEACGRYFASQSFLKHVAERTTHHTDKREHHLYCPTCAKLFSDRIRSSTRLKR